MTYLTFHLVFLLPPLLVLCYTQPRPLAGQGGQRTWWGLPLMGLIAFIYTTPWDNYLIYRGVWSYDMTRVIATVGYVPVEEYAFFLLQPLLTGLFLYQVLARTSLGRPAVRRPPPLYPAIRLLGAGFFLFLGVLGGVLLIIGGDRSLYTALILSWAGPVVAGLWFLVGNVAWENRGPFFLTVAAPTVYLWCADAVALRLDIWHISEATSLGVGFLGLPVEEAAFFLMTNLMVVLGLLLWLCSERAAGHFLLHSHSSPAAP